MPLQWLRPEITPSSTSRANSVVIVNPETCTPLPDGQVGEIWAHGPSIASGYWRNPEATQEHFRAELSGRPETHYLRTGDLGFLRDGELYITGRLRSLIIVNGRNYYPHDIEATLLGLHPAFRPHSAVFQTEGDHDSRIVLIQKIAVQLYAPRSAEAGFLGLGAGAASR